MNPTPPMPSYAQLQKDQPEQFDQLVQYVASLRASEPSAHERGTPESGTLPDTQVRAMFDRIARVYDRMNSVMTAGHAPPLARAGRRTSAQVGPGSRALDVATGTGDLAVALARRGAEVVGPRLLPAMLELARAKAPGLTFEEGQRAGARPTPDGRSTRSRWDSGRATSPTSTAGLAEMARVARPGGRVVVLEITTPQKPPLSWFFRPWFDTVVPALGRFAGDPDAYTYLPSSVRRFPGPEELAARMAAAGLSDVRWILTAGGIIAIHAGTRR